MSNTGDLDNFVHKLPGGYLRSVNPRMNVTPLRECISEIERSIFSEKRLNMTGKEFFDDIDTALRKIGVDIETTREEVEKLGLITEKWGQEFRAWWFRKDKKYIGDPPSDADLVGRRAMLEEKCRAAFEHLLTLGYKEEDLTI